MRTFLEAMNDAGKEGKQNRIQGAVACLDLSEIPATVREDKGVELAARLKEVVDRVRYVSWWNISDATDGQRYVFLQHEEGDIVIDRSDIGEWLFTKETVAAIPALDRAYANQRKVVGTAEGIGFISPSMWLRSKFAAPLRQVGFLLEHWQWIGLFLLVSIGVLLQRTQAFLINQRILARLKKREGWQRLRPKDTDLGRPVGIFILAILWWGGLRFVGLPAQAYAVLLIAVKVMATLACGSAALKVVNIGTDLWSARAQRTETRFDDLLVPLIRSILKTLVVVVATVFLATNLIENPASVLAGLGLGGLAFALAAQDIVSNLFGSFTLLMDRPFQIGDWVVIEGVEGNVEEVGFRTTRVRTFYNSLVTIPNSKITNSPIDNFGARRYRRAKTYLSVTYDTPPEKIEAFCEGIRELVRQRPDTRKDYYHVYFNQFSASSLDILLYIFFETPDWGLELKAKHEFYLDILRLAERLGVEFAFPTRTVHLHRGESPPLLPDEVSEGSETAPGSAKEAHRPGRTTGGKYSGK